MADSEIHRRGNALKYGGSDPKAKWNYQTGLFLKSLLHLWQDTDDLKYYSYIKEVIDSYVDKNGSIKTYKKEDYNIDKINSGKVLLALYQYSQDEKYKKAASLLKEQLETHPRTQEGGFWHKKRYPWQMWLDGIYMGSPFYAEFSILFNQPEGFDDVARQILLIDVHTRDPNTGLRYHGWDESNKQKWADPYTGCSPHFWGRAMGWYAMALVDVLDFFPLDHPDRDQILYILIDLVTSIAKYQDQDTGLWYQIVDLGHRRGNYLEASASSMFTYAIAKSVRKGYIDDAYWQVAEKGYRGLLNHLTKVESNGLVNLTQICSVAGLGGNPYRDGSFEYYINEPIVSNDLKGVGPFIMASLQIENRQEKTNLVSEKSISEN
jgi:unsaturated rhamnogalacturonyl hydrolase